MKRSKGAVKGIVQGVGFRPFVYQLANQFNLSGYIINNHHGVDIEVQGSSRNIKEFFNELQANPPALALISSVRIKDIPLKESIAFEIKESSSSDSGRQALISPDVNTCRECLAELKNPKDRRYKYPFINCTNCGPRYTIITDIPYDRITTTMNHFEMCPACRKEYEDPGNRRFHAQPNACWDCGPGVFMHDGKGKQIDCDDPVERAVSLLKEGKVLGIKGLGGFHLAVDAENHQAVVRLRRRKHREEKPLAVMVKDLNAARVIANINDSEAGILQSRQRPIVLLKKRRIHGLSAQVSPKNKALGIMLPYTPLHHLIIGNGFKALVMTSGNMTDEPINIDNNKAFQNLKGIADYFLVHNRDIYLRSDDSIVRVVDNIPRQVRRSRGYVPVPVFLPDHMSSIPSVLALGAELKNTVCLTKENRAFLSQHIGDMENLETLNFFELTVSHLKGILDIDPKVLAYDLHPDYLSSKFAREQKDVKKVAVQHHHAHIASCMAENGRKGPVIGLALDGTGLGTDGNIWGGEVFLADLGAFTRAAHLEYRVLPGGDAATRFPWRMALSHLYAVYGEKVFDLPLDYLKRLKEEESGIVLQIIKKGIGSLQTSSCGRLFDAVASLTGLRDQIAYEGQAAIELEMSLNKKEKGKYPCGIRKGNMPWIIETSGIIRGIVDDLIKGKSRGIIAARFHNSLIGLFTEVCFELRDEYGINQVAMSGGAFQNITLLEGMTRVLKEQGFEVFSHIQVPANDGGVSLGQAVIAGMISGGFKGEFITKYRNR